MESYIHHTFIIHAIVLSTTTRYRYYAQDQRTNYERLFLENKRGDGGQKIIGIAQQHPYQCRTLFVLSYYYGLYA